MKEWEGKQIDVFVGIGRPIMKRVEGGFSIIAIKALVSFAVVTSIGILMRTRRN